MIRKNLVLSLLSICLAMLYTNHAFAQITSWQADPSNATQYRVPQGWKVNVKQEQGVYVWEAKEDPSNPLGADITVLSMPDFPNSSPTFFINQLARSIQAFKLLETKQVSLDEYHYRASGQMEGNNVGCNLLFLRDRNSQFIYLASFSAEEHSYAQLGGTAVLYQALQRTDPFTAGTTPNAAHAPSVGTGNDAWNMQRLEVQNYLKTQGIAPQKEALYGKWLQSFSYQTGTATQDVASGQISYGERGYGYLLTFQTDDTYSLTYKYNSVNQGCRYQADIFENGRFNIEGRKLILYPSQYEGSYNICNKISPEKNTNPPTRYFELYMDQEGKRLLIIGQPLAYSISYETNANGTKYIQEGFNKTQ